jgi:hypothetical protein
LSSAQIARVPSVIDPGTIASALVVRAQVAPAAVSVATHGTE